MTATAASPVAYHNGNLTAYPKQGGQGQVSGQAPRPESKALPPSMLTPIVPARPSPQQIIVPGTTQDLPSVLKSPPDGLRHHLSPVHEESGGEPASNGMTQGDGINRSLAQDLLASSFQHHFSPNRHGRVSRGPDADSKSTTFHTPAPKGRASQHPEPGSQLVADFPEGAKIENQDMLNDAIRVVEGNAMRPPSDRSGDATTVYASVDEFRKDFKSLNAGLLAAIPSSRHTPDRTWSTMAVLLQKHVTAEELPALVAEGRLRDVVRSVVHCQLVYWPSFGLPGLFGLAMARYPVLNVEGYADTQAQELAAAINFALGYGIQGLAVGLGESGVSTSAEGQLDIRYNKQAPVHESVRRSAFWSFSIGHGLVDSGLVTQDMLPETVIKARIASGALCSVAVGLHRALLPYWTTSMDPAWLDASTPENAAIMRKAIDDLRQPRLEAVGGYIQDLGKGLAGGIGIPSMAALTRGIYRGLTALVVLSGRVVAFKVMDPQAKLATNVLTDVSLGALWGEATTLPGKAVECSKAALEAEKERRKPRGSVDVSDFVPSAVLTRRKARGQSVGADHK